jgi:hypothetical protein
MKIKTSMPAVTSIFFADEWDTVDDTKAEKPKVYLDFNTPPLALVIAMQAGGKSLVEIHETIRGLGQNPHVKTEHVVSADHQALAAEIYNHFAKKHIMRRLKNEHISEFMRVVDALCENRKRIDQEHVQVLVTLPRFFEQNRALEQVMKSAKSINRDKAEMFIPFEEELEFVNTVHIMRKNQDSIHYFWKTRKNKLVRFVIKNHDISNSVWKMLTKHGKIRVKSNYPGITHIQGYEYFVYHLGSVTEIDLV